MHAYAKVTLHTAQASQPLEPKNKLVEKLKREINKPLSADMHDKWAEIPEVIRVVREAPKVQMAQEVKPNNSNYMGLDNPKWMIDDASVASDSDVSTIINEDFDGDYPSDFDEPDIIAEAALAEKKRQAEIEEEIEIELDAEVANINFGARCR